MPPTRKLITTTIAAILLLGGCTANAQEQPSSTTTPATTTPASPPPTTEPPSPSPSPSPTAVESFPSAPATETAETAAIREGWEKYWEVVDKFASDPALTDLQETQEVAVGEAAAKLPTSIIDLREANLKMVGGRTFRDVVIGEPGANTDGVTTAEVTYCRDDSNMDLVDITTGEPSDRKPDVTTFKGTATMEKLPDGIWRVALKRDETASC